MELGVTLSSIKPLVPSVEGDDDVHHLEAHVCVQPGLIKQNGVHTDVDDRSRPAPDVLPDAQEDTDHSENRGDNFERMHGGVRVDLPRKSFNVARAATLVFLLSACFLRKPPTQPVNTPELPVV